MDSPCIKQTVCKVFKIFQCGKYLVAYVLNFIIAVKLNDRCMYCITYLSLTVRAATLIFISGSDSAISSAKQGKSGFIYNLVKSQ